MKVNYTHLAFIIFSFLLSIYLIALVSCSPNYHMRKFIKKGGVIEQTEKVVTLHDTIKGKDGKDSIIYRQVSVECPEPIIPKTRWQTRIEYRYKYKTYHDSIQVVKWKVKYVYKAQKSENKQEKKKGFWYNFRFISIIAFLILLIILLFKWK